MWRASNVKEMLLKLTCTQSWTTGFTWGSVNIWHFLPILMMQKVKLCCLWFFCTARKLIFGHFLCRTWFVNRVPLNPFCIFVSIQLARCVITIKQNLVNTGTFKYQGVKKQYLMQLTSDFMKVVDYYQLERLFKLLVGCSLSFCLSILVNCKTFLLYILKYN